MNVDVPALNGIPDNTPAADKLRPVGRTPDIREKPYGEVPADAVIEALYGPPTTPPGRPDNPMEEQTIKV